MATLLQTGPALALVGLSFVSCNPGLAIVFVCLALTVNAAAFSGFWVKKIVHWKTFFAYF
jgi:hypothetical protein